MKSKVYFAGVHSHGKQESLLIKIRKLFDKAGFGDMIFKGKRPCRVSACRCWMRRHIW